MFLYWLIIVICIVKVGIFFENNKIKIEKRSKRKINQKIKSI